MRRPTLFSLLLLSACTTSPAHESGRPDARPTPRTTDEAMEQAAAIADRARALADKGLCSSESIRSAPIPDERFWHCKGVDWDGSTKMKELLTKFQADPKAWAEFCNPFNFDVARIALCEGTAAEAEARKTGVQKDPWDWNTPKPKAGDK